MSRLKHFLIFLSAIGTLAMTIYAYNAENIFVSTVSGVLFGFFLSRLDVVVRGKKGKSFLQFPASFR